MHFDHLSVPDGIDREEFDFPEEDGFPVGAPIDVEALRPIELGRFGEALAAIYLESRGCSVLERNYRCAEGEADIVAYDELDEEIVLVEVKSRRVRVDEGDLYPEEAVGEAKRRRYRRIVSCYALDNYPVPAIRFDVIALVFVGGDHVNLTHYHDVFSWEGAQ